MDAFRRLLEERNTDPAHRRWIYVPYDQLTDEVGPLSREDPRDLGIVLLESRWKPSRRPYHKQKLLLILANLLHFGLEQAARGVAVKVYRAGKGPYRTALEEATRELGPIRVMRPAERELRVDLQPLFESGALQEVPHEGWLTTREQFQQSHPGGAPFLLERFYRHVRRQTGVLMQKNKPLGGQYNFDKENREPYRGEPPTRDIPRFVPDAVTQEAAEYTEQEFGHHPGKMDLATLPATRDDAQALWAWAKTQLPTFGKYEDAMSSDSSTLFHTRTSALVNICRLLPQQLVSEAAALDIPIASKEGFIRQVMGWREFMYHVHEATDGFRKMPNGEPPIASEPGDGGYRLWKGHAWEHHSTDEDPDGGALPSALGAEVPLPPAYWGRKSGLACIDIVVDDVWREAWSHHITRLMILSNFATLLGASPRQLTDWFWVAYIDAYDWVVEPNVLGLGTFATGQLFTTKPYVSGANYIRRMSDYCDKCRFVPGKTCPYTPMYWAFLERHRDLLSQNPRVRTLYRGMGDRGIQGTAILAKVRDQLLAGKELTPESIGTSAPAAAMVTDGQAALDLGTTAGSNE